MRYLSEMGFMCIETWPRETALIDIPRKDQGVRFRSLKGHCVLYGPNFWCLTFLPNTDNKNDEQMMPIRWMAPESIVDGKYIRPNPTCGRLVFCCGKSFLAAQRPTARWATHTQVIELILAGKRLSAPDICPQLLWSNV